MTSKVSEIPDEIIEVVENYREDRNRRDEEKKRRANEMTTFNKEFCKPLLDLGKFDEAEEAAIIASNYTSNVDLLN